MNEIIKDVESKLNSLNEPEVGKSIESSLGSVKFIVSKDVRNTYSEEKIYDYNMIMYKDEDVVYSGSFAVDSDGWNKIKENMRTVFNNEYNEIKRMEAKAKRKAMNTEKHNEEKNSDKGDKIMTVEERKEALFAEMIKEENMNKLVMMIEMMFESPINVRYTIEKDKTISISSDNIADNPILSLAWKEFRIEHFHSRMCYSKDFDSVSYWISVAYHYKNHGGGSNYSEIADIFFTEDLQWKMKK